MKPDQVIQAVKLLSFMEWGQLVGWLAAGVFFVIGIWLLLKEPDESKDPWMKWYAQWKVPITGMAFMIFGVWSTGGSGVILGAVRSVITLLIVGWLTFKVWLGLKDWMRRAPLPGMHYLLHGKKEIVVTAVGDSADLVTGVVKFQLVDDETESHTVGAFRFHFMADFMEEK